VLMQHDLQLLDVAPESAGGPSDQQLAAALAAVPDGAARTVLAIELLPGGAAQAERRARNWLRSGLANLGLFDLDPQIDAATLAALRRALSLQSQPEAGARGAR